VKVLEEQAKGVDPGRVFRVCDQLAEMEDKLRYVLSARTLVEMSLIRASRIATVATVEELMKAVKAMKSEEPHSAAVTPAAEAKPVAANEPVAVKEPETRREVMDDPRLNDILGTIPGATITNMKEGRRQ
jgi:DNA polymerase III gamma/tau subunit